MAKEFAALAGANGFIDAPSFLSGHRIQDNGMFILAIELAIREHGFPKRLRLHPKRIQWGYGVGLSGRREVPAERTDSHHIPVPEELFERLRHAAQAGSSR